jgi:hypothetical protein
MAKNKEDKTQLDGLIEVLGVSADTLRNAAMCAEEQPEFSWFQVGAVAANLKRLALDLEDEK